MRSLSAMFVCALVLTSVSGQGTAPTTQQPNKIKILFLGPKGGHDPEVRFKLLEPVLAKRGIELVYTGSVAALNPETLAKFDGLMIYANIDKITPDQEKALLDYVESGKGFIPLHCASYCLPQLAQIHRHGRRRVQEPRHRRFSHDHRRPESPDHERL